MDESGRNLYGSYNVTSVLNPESSRAGCSGLHPVRFWISARMGTTQNLWAASFDIGLLSQQRVASCV